MTPPVDQKLVERAIREAALDEAAEQAAKWIMWRLKGHERREVMAESVASDVRRLKTRPRLQQ